MKPIEKIYYAFFLSKKEKLYFNELKEVSGLKDSSLNKNLKELIIKNKVEKEILKSNTYYSLINKELIAVYFAKFSIEKFNLLNYKVKLPLNSLKEEITNIKYLIHFGSSSRGEEKKGSDIDLLIVLNDFDDINLNKLYGEKIKKQIDKIKEKVNSKSIYPISCFYVSLEDFINNKKDYLIISAKKTGYPLYNQIEYYKNIQNEC